MGRGVSEVTMKRETEEKGKRERESLCAERGEETQRERERGEKMGTKMSIH